jgi:hypothetical protein
MAVQYRRHAYVVKPEDRHRGENVALDVVSCATVPISSEGGAAKFAVRIKLNLTWYRQSMSTQFT